MGKKTSDVPTGRLQRLAGLGFTAGELALRGLAEGARRLASGSRPTADAFLTGANAAVLAKRLSHMRGAAMKLGQLLSLQGEDLVPAEFAGALAMLRDSADTMPPAQLRRVLGREYGKGWEERFERFDLEPIASASIGQVHGVRTADGRELVLKVQYPGVAKSIDSDLSSLAALLTMTRAIPVGLDTRGILAEARDQLHGEADYLAEAASLKRYGKLVRVEPDCVVPRVHDDLTTARILAMDRMAGTSLEEFSRGPARQSMRDLAGMVLLRLFLRELFEFRFVQTDPNFANYLVDEDARKVVLLDLGGARAYTKPMAAQSLALLRAGRHADRSLTRATLHDMGFFAPEEPARRVEAVVDMVLLLAEPMHTPGVYDFGNSDLAARVSRARMDLVLHQGYVRAPPPWTLFLLRKFAGMWFLLHRLHARVDVRGVTDPFLEPARD